MATLAVEGLSFAYPGAEQEVLQDVAFEAPAGSYAVIIGPSGCGKTTLLRQVKPALAPAGRRSGRVLLGGEPIDDMTARDQVARIGFVQQDPDAQMVCDRVLDELAFGLENLGIEQGILRLRVAEAASYLGIEGLIGRLTRELSGGQKQLVNLAAALALRPDVLVLDEPTAQLDPLAAAGFLDALRQVNQELGLTVIMAAHRLEGALADASQVIAMRAGRVLADGAPRQVAAQLLEAGDRLGAGLPAPARIFHEVQASERRQAGAQGEQSDGPLRGGLSAAGDGNAPDAADAPMPLCVREGRRWLAAFCAAHPIAPGLPADPSPHSPFSDDESAGLAIEVREAWLRYGRDLPDVLRGASLSVKAGSWHGLLGGNGAGKSTLLQVICGLQRPYQGSVRVLGRRLKGGAGSGRCPASVALLPQDPTLLFASGTVREDLEAAAGARPGATGGRAERASQVAEKLGIGRLLEAHPFDLSGGERQLVALAIALMDDPKVLLLDEPAKGVDAQAQATLARQLHRLVDEGRTILMATHDVEFCALHVDQVTLLFDGQDAATEAPHRFFESNRFYTTVAARMSRGLADGAITADEVVARCLGKEGN